MFVDNQRSSKIKFPSVSYSFFYFFTFFWCRTWQGPRLLQLPSLRSPRKHPGLPASSSQRTGIGHTWKFQTNEVQTSTILPNRRTPPESVGIEETQQDVVNAKSNCNTCLFNSSLLFNFYKPKTSRWDQMGTNIGWDHCRPPGYNTIQYYTIFVTSSIIRSSSCIEWCGLMGFNFSPLLAHRQQEVAWHRSKPHWSDCRFLMRKGKGRRHSLLLLATSNQDYGQSTSTRLWAAWQLRNSKGPRRQLVDRSQIVGKSFRYNMTRYASIWQIVTLLMRAIVPGCLPAEDAPFVRSSAAQWPF